MFERRDAVPLLTKRVASGNGVLQLGKGTTCQTLLAGILFGVVLGMFLSVTLFSFLPSARDRNEKGTVTDLLPSIKDEDSAHHFEQRHDEVIEERREESEEDKSGTVEDRFAIGNDVMDKTEEPEVPKLRLNEGTRELSEFERTGGWRFTPEILTVSNHFSGTEVISPASPRVILLKQFLTEAEIAHVLDLASSHMSRSKVVGGKDGAENNVRTSYGAWLTERYRDDTVQRIESRIHDAVGIPREFGEGIYVLRYETTQKYNPHTDNCARAGEQIKDSCLGFLKRSGGPECGEGHGGASCGDRIATFIMYLKSPTSGGETLFPKSDISLNNLKKAGRKSMVAEFAESCQSPLYFKLSPSPGDAVLFWDYVPRDDISNHTTFERSGSWDHRNTSTEAVNDNSALHGGCPVLEGEKWIATKWIRSRVFK